jgi:hypothetical protein
MKEIPLTKRDPIFARFTADMVESLRALPYEKKISTEQAESTKRIMSRPKEEDEAWFNRPLPENCSIKPEVWANASREERDALVNARPVTVEEVDVIQDIRKKGRNNVGKTNETSVTSERKEAAVNAFTYTPPAPLTVSELERLVRMVPITEPEPIDIKEPKKKTLDGRLMHKLWKNGLIPGTDRFSVEKADEND